MATVTAQPKQNWLSTIQKKGTGLPSRILFYGVEGIGKTSFAAQANKPVFLISPGETGLQTLIDNGQVKETPYFPETRNWTDLRSQVQTLITEEHDFKTCVLDTANGFERVCHEHVCKTQFGGDWGEKGFASFNKGYDISLTPWLELLADLDKLRQTRKMQIIFLAHSQITTFQNPEGPDYNRYQADMNRKTWGITCKWTDYVIFANFHSVASKEKGDTKAKGRGGKTRVMYTERSAAFDAKNRCMLPAEIEMGTTPAEAWANFRNAIEESRKSK